MTKGVLLLVPAAARIAINGGCLLKEQLPPVALRPWEVFIWGRGEMLKKYEDNVLTISTKCITINWQL